ncbi:MAG TPA: 23S rRNA (pseudouridine(1915)-N(3))-methyltransferase RlmH [Chlamydiales bacterium]|jgi:23S rRNA (pseudouridine1915-N3)-methyltransferase
MFKIKVYTVGKLKESWLQEALAEYEKRLSKRCQLEWILKDTLPEAPWIALDVRGELLSSEAFSKKWMQYLVKHGSRANILIGGPEGIPETLLVKSAWRLSLSPLTLTHQMVRLLLTEQIYRAFEIEGGSSYHK